MAQEHRAQRIRRTAHARTACAGSTRRPSGNSRQRSAQAITAGLWVATTTLRPARIGGQAAQQRRLGIGIEERGGFVQQQHLRVAQQQAGQADAAGFATGQAEAAFADHRVQPLRQALCELQHLRGLGHRAQPRIAGAGIGQAQVVGDAAVEQVRTLAGIGHLHARAQLQLAGARRQPAGQRFQQRAFAGPAGTDQGQALARLQQQVQIRSTSCGAPSGRSTSPRCSGGKAASAGSTASGATSFSIRPCSSGSDCSRRSTSAAAASALARSW
jgi:hypothetical protein